METTRFLRKHPSAWLPVLMSFAALVFLVSYMAFFGIQQSASADEGLPARIFQILMLGQLPVMVFFIYKWVARMPRQGLQILILQVISAIMVLVSVYLLEI